jgi:hypothetical protein
MHTLAPAISHRDSATPLVLYGDAWAEGDRIRLPDFDYPAGLPAWTRQNDGWARRVGSDDLGKRRNITITITKGVVQLPPHESVSLSHCFA